MNVIYSLSSAQKYMLSEAFTSRALFLQDTKLRVQRSNLSQAVSETLRLSNIKINLSGDVSKWGKDGQGALLFGDHRNGFEYVPLLGALGELGRKDVHFVAKPFSLQSKITQFLDPYCGDLTLPVIPSTLASDRDNIFNRDIIWRLRTKGQLPTLNELKRLNHDTLFMCRELIRAGHIVVIYPAGGVIDALNSPWRKGIGSIVKMISEVAYENTMLVPFRFDDFSRTRLFSALIMRSHGVVPKEMSITLNIGKQGYIQDIIGNKEVVEMLTPSEMAEILRNQYIDNFGTL